MTISESGARSFLLTWNSVSTKGPEGNVLLLRDPHASGISSGLHLPSDSGCAVTNPKIVAPKESASQAGNASSLPPPQTYGIRKQEKTERQQFLGGF